MTDTPPEFTPHLQAEDMLQPFDVRDSSGKQGLIKLLGAAALLLVVAFVLLKFYQPGVRDRDDPPRITAENTPFKVRPETAGGTQTPNQDKVVFDVMDGQTPDEVVTPAPAPEVPIKLPEVERPVVATPNFPAPKPIETRPTQRPVVIAPSPRPAVTTPAPTPQPTPAYGNSNWVVQVASVRSEADALAGWTDMTRKYPSILAGRSVDIKRVDLAEKGIYFRTRVAGLPDKAAASDLCASLKSAGQACFVAKR